MKNFICFWPPDPTQYLLKTSRQHQNLRNSKRKQLELLHQKRALLSPLEAPRIRIPSGEQKVHGILSKLKRSCPKTTDQS